jgi:hypothetical protein
MALFTTTLGLYGGVLWSGELQGFIIHEMMPTASSGRFLIRLSDSLFLAPQSDLEKNQNAVRKGLARNAQIRGVFGSPP